MADGGLITVGWDAATAVQHVLQSPGSAIQLEKRDVALLVLVQDRLRRSGATELELGAIQELASVVAQAEGGRSISETAVRNDVSRMLDMRVLLRTGAPGVSRECFRLGPVGREIADGWRFVPDDEAERMDAVLGEANIMLAEAANRAEAIAGGSTEWTWRDVAMRVERIVADGMLRAVERRQSQLDRWQAVTRDHVQGMLSSRWDEALDACERTLTDSLSAAREMKRCVDTQSPRLLASLDRIIAAGHPPTRQIVIAVDETSAIIDRVVEWTSSRFEEWSRFVDQAMAFIQGVVRADPGRILARLIDVQMRAYCEICDEAAQQGDDDFAPWALPYPRPVRFLRLRDPDVEAPPPMAIRQDAMPPTVQPDRTWMRLDADVRSRIGHLLTSHGRADLEDVIAPWRSDNVLMLSRIVGMTIRHMAAHGTPVTDPSAARQRERVEIVPGLIADRFAVLRRD